MENSNSRSNKRRYTLLGWILEKTGKNQYSALREIANQGDGMSIAGLSKLSGHRENAHRYVLKEREHFRPVIRWISADEDVVIVKRVVV